MPDKCDRKMESSVAPCNQTTEERRDDPRTCRGVHTYRHILTVSEYELCTGAPYSTQEEKFESVYRDSDFKKSVQYFAVDFQAKKSKSQDDKPSNKPSRRRR